MKTTTLKALTYALLTFFFAISLGMALWALIVEGDYANMGAFLALAILNQNMLWEV